MFSLQAAATLFAIFVLPETKGRSLEQLERELSEMRICGDSVAAQPRRSFGSGGGDGDASASNSYIEDVSTSQSQKLGGANAGEASTPSKIEWEPEFERTVGLHSTGGVGMQK